MRLTARNLVGMAYVPGYVPKSDDSATCELIARVTNRLAAIEDTLEKFQDRLPDEFIDELKRRECVG